jgi:hypothetical protein
METLTREQERKIVQILDFWTHDLVRAINTKPNKTEAVIDEVRRLKFVLCDSDEHHKSKKLAEAC